MAVSLDAGGSLAPPLSDVVRHAKDIQRFGALGLWWPDHLMGWFPESIWDTEFGVAPSAHNPNAIVDPFMAAAATTASCDFDRLGVVVTDPYRRHPAVLLQSAATAAEAGQSYVLGIGAGATLNLAPYGLATEKRVAGLRDALRLLRSLRDGEGAIDYAGSHFSLSNAVLGAQTRREVEYWVGGSSEVFTRIAGTFAEGWIPTRIDAEDYARQAEILEETARAHARAVPTKSMYVWVIVAETHERAHELVEAPFLKSLLFFRRPEYFEARGLPHPLATVLADGHYLPSKLDRKAATDALEATPDGLLHDYILHGTPDDVVRWASDLESSGLEHAVLYDVAPFVAGGSRTSRYRDLWTT